MWRIRPLISALAATILVAAPAAAADTTTHHRVVDRTAFVWATTYPADGLPTPGVVYRDSYIQVSDQIVRDDGSGETRVTVSLETWEFTFDRTGTLTVLASTLGDLAGAGIAFEMDNQASGASLEATVPGVRTTYGRRGSETTAAVTLHVSGTWTATGDMWRGYSNSHMAGGASVANIHYRGSGRDEVAFAGAIEGQDVGRVMSSMLSTQINANISIDRSRAMQQPTSHRSTVVGARPGGGHLRGTLATAFWSTYPYGGEPVPGVVYAETQVFAATRGSDPTDPDGAEVTPFVSVYQSRFMVDDQGNWIWVSEGGGWGGGPAVVFTHDRSLTSASVAGVVSMTTCTLDGCSDGLPVAIEATWIAQGPLTRLVQNERVVAGDVMLHRHAREQSRDALATGSMGSDALGASTWAVLSTNAEWSFTQPR